VSDEQLPNLTGSTADPKPPGRATMGAGPTPSGAPGGESLAAVMELEMPVSIELGRTRMAVEEVLALGRGSVVQLDRLVGQPVEVFVSDKPFATGEVVVMGEKFGVRILRIREPTPRAGAPS
jgi:flagellar motor switch protein FliN